VLLEERAHVVGRVVPRDVLRDEPRPRLHLLLRHRLRRRGASGRAGRDGGAVTAGAGSEGDVARAEAQAKRGLALAGGGAGRRRRARGSAMGRARDAAGGEDIRGRVAGCVRGLAGFYPPRQNIPVLSDSENVRGQRPCQVPCLPVSLNVSVTRTLLTSRKLRRCNSLLLNETKCLLRHVLGEKNTAD